MNNALSALCALIAIAVVLSAGLYAAYCVFVAVFGTAESGQAMGTVVLCVLGFFGLMAVMAKVNAR